ncbi:MAG: branched-chain amino acid ABC transporter permease, partial [Alphaproteobacteria bacterium]
MIALPHPRRGGLLILATAIFVLPLFLRNDFHYDIAILAGINAIACVGLNLLIGYTGQISLGHAGFFGLGAYASALLTGNQGWPALAALAAAALGVAALAFLIAHPILKLRGHYLAMGTLGMGIIIAIVLNQEIDLTGGPDGMPVSAFTLAGWEPSGSLDWYWIVGGVLFV